MNLTAKDKLKIQRALGLIEGIAYGIEDTGQFEAVIQAVNDISEIIEREGR